MPSSFTVPAVSMIIVSHVSWLNLTAPVSAVQAITRICRVRRHLVRVYDKRADRRAEARVVLR